MQRAGSTTVTLKLLSLVIALGYLMAARPALADKRVALVIGNSDYQHVPRLDNPSNDARLMARTLKNLGFQLIGNGPQIDLDKAAFDGALQKFSNALVGADVALFYYAGHGMQVHGENFLVPVSANPTRVTDVYLQMVDTNVVLSQMEGAGTKLNIVLLDACRNNPFGGRGIRAVSGGLAQMQAPKGTLISYATQPGSVALDGEGADSPYSKALADTIGKPGLGLFEAFNQVGLKVQKETGGAQQPWVSSSPIAGTFYFAGAPGGGPAIDALKQPATADDAARQDFAVAQKIDTSEIWQGFLQNHPTGMFASAARARLAELQKKQLAMVSPPGQSITPPAPPPLTGRLTGVWRGTYYYSRGNRKRPVHFVFTFGPRGCPGRSEEPNTFGDRRAPKLFANLFCRVSSLAPGQVVTIRKTYDGTGGVSHSVIYTGTVSPDMRRISGRWAINNVRGNFIMSR